jgi:peptidoglycan/LPS O-acetylase OafA/YrhL
MTSMRHHALDNLRVFVIFLVVVLHASLSYMAYAPQWWYVLDPQRSLFFTCAVLVIDVPIMLIMFFLSGYFSYASLAKRGPSAFLQDKLVRIGLPWLFGCLVLAPPTAYMIYFSRHAPMSLWTFWATDFWGKAFQQSVYWYLGVLLLFFALTALLFTASRAFATWKPTVKQPTWRLFAVFFLLVTGASFLLNLTHPLDQWSHIYVLVYQPARVPLYIGYFVLGIYAHQQGWFTEGGYSPSLARWLILCLVSGLVYLEWRLSVPPTVQTVASKAITTFLFNLFCFSSLLASVALFRAHVGSETPFWRSQARNSYGVYYLHPLFLYPLALVFVPFPISIFVKAAVITLLAYLGSWALSAAVLTRLPGLRRMF